MVYVQTLASALNELILTDAQVCMKNVKEYKCVLFNGQRQYLAHNCYDRGTAYSVYPHEEILSFAENAIRCLASQRPAAILDSIVRVDIFKRNNGSLVVNEFESFEADHHAAWHYKADSEFTLNAKIDAVYEAILRKYVDKQYMLHLDKFRIFT
jgi:hypothetical protein